MDGILLEMKNIHKDLNGGVLDFKCQLEHAL